MRIGFIGLGNVGGKLAGSLIRNKFNIIVRDLDSKLTKNEHDKEERRKEFREAIHTLSEANDNLNTRLAEENKRFSKIKNALKSEFFIVGNFHDFCSM